MTRFSITLKEGVEFVEWCLNKNFGGEIFVPKIPSFKIIDLAKAINSNAKINVIGVRPGEKIHEEMVSENEGLNTLELTNSYIILNNSELNLVKKIKNFHSKKIKERFFLCK